MSAELTIVPAAEVDRDALIDQIREEHQAALRAAGNVRKHGRLAVEHAVKCGRLLNQLKAQTEHGQFGAARRMIFNLDRNGERQFQKYQRLAKAVAEGALSLEAKSDSHLTIDGCVKLLSKPKPKAPTPPKRRPEPTIIDAEVVDDDADEHDAGADAYRNLNLALEYAERASKATDNPKERGHIVQALKGAAIAAELRSAPLDADQVKRDFNSLADRVSERATKADEADVRVLARELRQLATYLDEVAADLE